MVVALLYEMQSPCNCFTLSLSGSDSRKSNKLARRQRCYDGDQGVAPVTMVIRRRRRVATPTAPGIRGV